jgi:hypothetical protein
MDMPSAVKNIVAARLLAATSIILAVGCVVAAVAEGDAGTFDRTFALHSVLLWLWVIATIAAIVLSRFTWYYFLLLILSPVAIAPIPSWMFILFRILHVRFAP